MKVFAKRFFTQLGSLTLGVGMIAANGVFMLTQKQPNITHTAPVALSDRSVKTSSTETDAFLAALNTVEKSSARTVTAIQLPESSGYKKASLEDYRMLLKIDKKMSKAEKEAKAENGVYYEIDTTKIYDPKPEPLNFTETRSVADEYFTVDDIISGSRVTLNAHELLCQAVYSEIGGEWDEDAIKAQVVAAYSYLRFNDTMDLVPTVGLKQNYPEKIEKCVSAVEGQAVFYDGEIINAVYSASTAGYSIESERIWEVYYPYLRAVVSEYDNEDPNYGLEYEFTEDEVRSIIESNCGITLSDDVNNWFEMQDVYSGMYIGYVKLDGQKTVTARTMQEMFELKSQAFTITLGDGKILFKSFGWGHGVGMSQWGACLYAKHGYTYDQILRHYYLDTTIGLSKESSKAVERGNAYKTPTADSSDGADTNVNSNQPDTASADSAADTSDSTPD